MKRFVAVLMMAGGLLVAGGANAANVATITTTNCGFGTYSQTTVNGSVGDTFTITSTASGCSFFTSSNTNVLTVANNGNTVINVPLLVTLVGSGTAILDFGFPAITVTVAAPAPTAQAVPSLSEWAQLMLGLMVISMLGWQWRKQQS